MDQHINQFRSLENRLEYVITSCTLTQKNLEKYGINPQKIVKIPIGVDIKHFVPTEHSIKMEFRRKIGIPDNAFVVGSFQKDGEGWDDGIKPKMIKGPDTLIKTLKELSRHINVFVLLTGPSRGYVKQELDRLNIPYLHRYVDDYLSLPLYYGVIDAYLVTSREEGGPKGILESMACGIPVVSTTVGMANDIIQDEKNGYICNVEDHIGLSNSLLKISSYQSPNLVQNALSSIRRYDWEEISNEHYNKVYKNLV